MSQVPPRRQARPADPCAMVIFGASGDMTKRLMVPALYNLSRKKMLPDKFALIGVDLAEGTDQSWRDELYEMLKSFVSGGSAEVSEQRIDEEAWKRLADKMVYVPGDLTKSNLYDDIRDKLSEAEKAHDTQGNVIFYLAVADRFFGTVVDQLGNANLTNQNEDADGESPYWRRVVIEKPFGHNLDAARELNARILRTLHEDQIFRIDHFLGKDTVQSIMAFRFANGLFEPIWNRDRIDHVQITAAETVGVEQRGKFYEATGALRDMVPNHAFALMSMVAMEPPTGFDAAAIRDKKAEVFAAMPAINPSRAVRGQYGAGVAQGTRVKAYRSEPNVAPESNIETYVAMELEIDNWRWAGVPFYFRTGKHMSHRTTEIAIRFKQAPYAAFQDTPVESLRPNWLVLRISPDESISLQFEVKRPGPVVDLAAVKMDFHYDDWFPKEQNVGYETLIYDVMVGDPTLFIRADMVEQAWRIVQPVLDAWAAEKTDFPDYDSGSDGPKAADDLLARSGARTWRPVESTLGAEVMTAHGNIRLLVTDVDGTLLTDKKVLTDGAIAAARELQAAGIILAITSGRPPRGMSMLIEPLALKNVIAGFNGGVFVNPDLSVVESHMLDPQTAQQALRLIIDQGLDAWVYTVAEWLVRDKKGPHVAHEAWAVQFDPKVVASFPDAALAHAVKIVGISDNFDLVTACEKTTHGILGEKVSIARSQSYYLDVTSPQANKGAVISTLSQRLDIPSPQIATIGDMPTDVLMFRKSGLSIAMGNAADAVKAAASVVTDSNDDEGFANAVRKYILPSVAP